jgi:TetR/AcrR family acrAB operon transcriptional repressor
MRRSREDSLKTRGAIVLAARRVFARRGVSRTTLEQIAAAAGVTRGAIYGHFADKQALFQCMREQVKLPMVDVIDSLLIESADDPLTGVERFLAAVIEALASDAATRETFQILGFKCEYVGEIEADLERQADRASEFRVRLERAYRRAARAGKLRRGITPRLAALETGAFLMGAVRLWLLDRAGGPVRRDAAALVRAHVRGLRGP